MLITNENDILFDDLTLIGLSGQSATIPFMIGDCNNRYETETVENDLQVLIADANCDCGR